MAWFSTLPDELIEDILIACAANNDAFSVAAVAATSRRFYSTIYNTTDHHLWRSLFLALFDDPRELDRSLILETDWKKDLQDRTWAGRFFTHGVQSIRMHHLRSSQPAVCTVHPPPPTDESTHLRALQTIISVKCTARPYLDSRAANVAAADVRAQLAPGQSFDDSVQRHAHTPASWPPNVAPQRTSLNVSWLRRSLSNGLPASLTTQVVLDDFNEDDDWHETSEGLAMGQIISHLGFLPIPTVESDVDTETETVESEPDNVTVAPAPADSSGHPTPIERSNDIRLAIGDMTEETQRKRAHWHSRQRVFDFDYLSRRRNWGPYLPVRSQRRYTGSAVPDNSVVDSDSDDPDWVPGYGTQARAAKVPPADKLHPDWSWLAAARMVAEFTLRAEHQDEGLKILGAWNNVREGAWLAGGAHCKDTKKSDEDDSAGPTASANDAEGRDDKILGYDWAGAEGSWRRFVCWLGYDDLVFHHQNGKYDDPDLEEVYIITPLVMRITGYSPSPIAAYADRPTIHIEGETGGPGIEGNVYLGIHTPRRVHGTVSMLANGSVRWSMISMNEDNTTDQWSSEAVQLGGVGSAMGALGMWTGVDHEDDDPLGVVWQWRVG